MMTIVHNDKTGMVIVCLICLAIISVYLFLKMSREEQIAKVKEWLLWAVCQAEKELGSKMGKLKLRMTYDMFVSKFNWVAKIITFEEFSGYVDEALVEMKSLIESNELIKGYIGGGN